MKLLHYSEDPSITVFHPHIAATATEPEPLVWAIDDEHAPSYWFPRNCPRACCWAMDDDVPPNAAGLLGLGGARRMHATEMAWLERIRRCQLYEYEFDPAPFALERKGAGYWVARVAVRPISVKPAGDLLAKHAGAGIELRLVNNLWPLIDAIAASGLQFSIIRKSKGQPRVKVSA